MDSIFTNLSLISEKPLIQFLRQSIYCCRYLIFLASSAFSISCKVMICFISLLQRVASTIFSLSRASSSLLLRRSASKLIFFSMRVFTKSPLSFIFSFNLQHFCLQCRIFLFSASFFKRTSSFSLFFSCAYASILSLICLISARWLAFSISLCSFKKMMVWSRFSSSYLYLSFLWQLQCIFKLQSMNKEIQEAINFAKIAEQTQRYEDMVKYMKEAVKIIRNGKGVFKEEEIRLFCNAYKSKINSRRTAWRALQILHSKEANTKNRSSAIIQFYKEDIEKQIREICQEAISTIDGIFKGETLKMSIKLELYKMRGDFHRYLCEISKDQDELKKLQKECEMAYKKGIEQLKIEEKRDIKEKKESQIQSYDAKRLAIYLNLSVFYYEIMLALPKAIETCEEGFNSALENISDLQEAKYIDSVTIMQLMHDNITAWRAEKEKNK